MKQGGSSTVTIMPESAGGIGLSVVEAPPHKEELEWKLEQAREQLLTLRRQQDDLERQKSDIEELRRKQEEYVRGKTEMIDHLSRGLFTLEREQIQSQRLAEMCTATRGAFQEYLDQLQAINDQDWAASELRAELSAALGVIENSRLEFNRARTKLDCLNPAAGQQPAMTADGQTKPFDWDEMVHYALIGAAASAPLIVAGTIWLIILLSVKH